jgi:nitroreductase
MPQVDPRSMFLLAKQFRYQAQAADGQGQFHTETDFSLGLLAQVSAPSGGNMQRWRFLVIRDPKVQETVGALYKTCVGRAGGPTVSIG